MLKDFDDWACLYVLCLMALGYFAAMVLRI